MPLINSPEVAHTLTGLASASAILVFLWLSQRMREPEGMHYDLSFALTLVVMLLVSPLGWMYYFPVLLLSIALAWQAAGRSFRRWRWRGLLALGWLLSSTPCFLTPAAQMNRPLDWFTRGGSYFYALLLLGVALAGLIYEQHVGAHDRGLLVTKLVRWAREQVGRRLIRLYRRNSELIPVTDYARQGHRLPQEHMEQLCRDRGR